MTSACLHATMSPPKGFCVLSERERSLAHLLDELLRHAYASSMPPEADSTKSLKRAAVAAAQGPSKERSAVVWQVRLSAYCAVVGRFGMGKSKSLKALLAARGGLERSASLDSQQLSRALPRFHVVEQNKSHS